MGIALQSRPKRESLSAPRPRHPVLRIPPPLEEGHKKIPFKTIKRIPPGTHPSRTCSPRPTCCLTHTCRMRTGHTRSTCFKTCFCAIRVEINSTSKIIAGKPKILLSLIGGVFIYRPCRILMGQYVGKPATPKL